MTRRPFLLIAVTLLACWGCGLDAVADRSPLSFAIREGYYVDPPPPPPHIALILETETIYPCVNYHLEGSLGVTGNVLRVDVPGRVTEPNVCLTAIGPAQYKVALPISTGGTYTLEFTRDGLTDRYTVTVTASAIEIATVESHFTHPTVTASPGATSRSDSKATASQQS